jgi:hypothetical protein
LESQIIRSLWKQTVWDMWRISILNSVFILASYKLFRNVGIFIGKYIYYIDRWNNKDAIWYMFVIVHNTRDSPGAHILSTEVSTTMFDHRNENKIITRGSHEPASRRTEGRTDKRTEVKQYTPSPSGERGYN